MADSKVWWQDSRVLAGVAGAVVIAGVVYYVQRSSTSEVKEESATTSNTSETAVDKDKLSRATDKAAADKATADKAAADRAAADKAAADKAAADKAADKAAADKAAADKAAADKAAADKAANKAAADKAADKAAADKAAADKAAADKAADKAAVEKAAAEKAAATPDKSAADTSGIPQKPIDSMSVRELRSILDGAGVSYAGVIDKGELRSLARGVVESQANAAPTTVPAGTTAPAPVETLSKLAPSSAVVTSSYSSDEPGRLSVTKGDEVHVVSRSSEWVFVSNGAGQFGHIPTGSVTVTPSDGAAPASDGITVTSTWTSTQPGRMSVNEGDVVYVASRTPDWLFVHDGRGNFGHIPTSCLGTEGDRWVPVRPALPRCTVLHDFQDDDSGRLSVTAGEVLFLVNRSDSFCYCEKATGESGHVPRTHLQQMDEDSGPEEGGVLVIEDYAPPSWSPGGLSVVTGQVVRIISKSGSYYFCQRGPGDSGHVPAHVLAL